MQRTIAIYLILSLLACPLVCAGDQPPKGNGKGKLPRTCGCCEHESRTGTDQSDSSRRPPAPRGHSCQCICGGAIAGDAGAYFVAFDWSWSLPIAVINSAGAQLFDESQLCAVTAPWPDVGLNHGRALCYLFSTMQC